MLAGDKCSSLLCQACETNAKHFSFLGNCFKTYSVIFHAQVYNIITCVAFKDYKPNIIFAVETKRHCRV